MEDPEIPNEAIDERRHHLAPAPPSETNPRRPNFLAHISNFPRRDLH